MKQYTCTLHVVIYKGFKSSEFLICKQTKLRPIDTWNVSLYSVSDMERFVKMCKARHMSTKLVPIL